MRTAPVESDMHLVVGIDGSEASNQALQHAADIVDQAGGEVTALAVVDPQVYEQRDGRGPITDREDALDRIVLETVEDAEQRSERYLEEAMAAVEADVTTALLYGSPVEAIVDYVSDRGDIDGIVVGHKRVDSEYERVLGSVAKGLIDRSPVPVTVVRDQ